MNLKNCLKKKISFDFKDMGKSTIYVKVKKEDHETFCLFMQGCLQKKTNVKSYQEITEDVYAPFCIIFGYKPSDFKVKVNGWKKIADSILNEPNIFLKIKNLDYENFKDKDILKT